MQDYKVESVIGEGAYGVVLRARHLATSRRVAVKKFKDSVSASDREMIARTSLREVKILRQLSHPNVVTLLDAFRKRGRLYLVFEFMEKNMLEVLEARQSEAARSSGSGAAPDALVSCGLDPDLVRMYIYQLLCAIAFCHARNVLHRDIKPENLLVSGETLKLCDFGFARCVSGLNRTLYRPGADGARKGSPDYDDDALPSISPSVPRAGVVLTDYVATRWYRAPELLLGTTDYGAPSDVWACACIMGELLDGDPLFPGETELDQLTVIQRMIGPLTDEQVEIFYSNERFVGTKVPYVEKPSSSIDRRYLGVQREALRFMKAVLKMDPRKRLTALECLQHAYFDPVRRQADLDLIIGALPDPSMAPRLSNKRASRGKRDGDRQAMRSMSLLSITSDIQRELLAKKVSIDDDNTDDSGDDQPLADGGDADDSGSFEEDSEDDDTPGSEDRERANQVRTPDLPSFLHVSSLSSPSRASGRDETKKSPTSRRAPRHSKHYGSRAQQHDDDPAQSAPNGLLPLLQLAVSGHSASGGHDTHQSSSNAYYSGHGHGQANQPSRRGGAPKSRAIQPLQNPPSRQRDSRQQRSRGWKAPLTRVKRGPAGYRGSRNDGGGGGGLPSNGNHYNYVYPRDKRKGLSPFAPEGSHTTAFDAAIRRGPSRGFGAAGTKAKNRRRKGAGGSSSHATYAKVPWPPAGSSSSSSSNTRHYVPHQPLAPIADSHGPPPSRRRQQHRGAPPSGAGGSRQAGKRRNARRNPHLQGLMAHGAGMRQRSDAGSKLGNAFSDLSRKRHF